MTFLQHLLHPKSESYKNGYDFAFAMRGLYSWKELMTPELQNNIWPEPASEFHEGFYHGLQDFDKSMEQAVSGQRIG